MSDSKINTKEKLDEALKEAMKAHDELRKRTLRMALSAIRMAEIDKRSPSSQASGAGSTSAESALSEAQVIAILQKEIKVRQEAVEEAKRASRPDLEEASRQEILVLEEFLPKQLTQEELDLMARQAIAESGASSVKDMGAVMKILMPRLQGRAAGDQASQTVKRLLGG